MQQIVECVPNFSNGRDPEIYGRIVDAIRTVKSIQVLDISADADHNRTVVTYVGQPDDVVEAGIRAIATAKKLIEEGRMTDHGLKEVEAAKADGRWDRAYRSKGNALPPDLQAAIDAEPKASAMLAKLNAQNRFALAFRTDNMKTEAGRKKKIADLVAMLKRGETIYPQKVK